VEVSQTVALWGADVSVGDSSASATVVVIVVVLLGLAVGLGALAVWLWRVTAVDSPSLMVLEQMSSRRYRDADDDERTALRASAIPLIADDAKIDDEVRSEE
jgi:hypothetical protein